MKIKLAIILFCLVHPIFSQQKDTLFLSNINILDIHSLNEQGLKLFKKSDCVKKNEEYFSIPEFLVKTKVPLQNLKFDKRDTLLSALFVSRKSTKNFLNEIRWSVFLKRNTCVQSSSDFKMFHCYNVDSRFVDIREYDRFKIKDILYLFHLYNVDLSFSFIVTDDKDVFVHLDRSRKVITLEEFNMLYENGEIKRFTDNPFKN